MAFVSERPLKASEVHNRSATMSILESASALNEVTKDELLSAIVLEAVDLCPTNILVSNDDPTYIVAIIDWEGTRTTPIWNVTPWMLRGMWDDTISPEEGKDLDQFLLDEIQRLYPAWGEARYSAKGKELRNLTRRAKLSTWNIENYIHTLEA